MKETMIEVYSLDQLVCGAEEITEANINLERIRFQVDGNTSLHYFALDYDKLTLILDYMQYHRKEYLTAILMKNNKNKSPLDIVLDNESPKNTQLLLRKLKLFQDSSLSALFYSRFNELLAMNISAFEEYLNSCYFQTMQMNSIKYLKLKNNDDPLLVPHSSCLIDEVFIEKYCRNTEKKELEEAKKKKEEEDKKKEEEEKRKAEEDKEAGFDQNPNKNSMVERDSEEELLDEVEQEKPMTKEEIEKEKERRKQKMLDIRAIEFDWIFNKTEGVQFLKTLASTDNIELFSLDLIKHIIRFCWGYYRKYIVIFLFIPYMIYITSFVLYSTWIHKEKIDRNNGNWESYGLANSIMVIFLLLMISYFSYYEIRQILFHKLSYFISFWNLVDISSLILNFVI